MAGHPQKHSNDSAYVTECTLDSPSVCCVVWMIDVWRCVFMFVQAQLHAGQRNSYIFATKNMAPQMASPAARGNLAPLWSPESCHQCHITVLFLLSMFHWFMIYLFPFLKLRLSSSSICTNLTDPLVGELLQTHALQPNFFQTHRRLFWILVQNLKFPKIPHLSGWILWKWCIRPLEYFHTMEVYYS